MLANRGAVQITVLRWLMHDMRNPVQALCLLTEVASGPGERTGEPRLADALSEFCQRISGDLSLLERVLRPEPADLSLRPVAIAEVVRFAADLIRRSKTAPALDASGALTPTLPAVAGIPEHLDRVLLNLVINALEALGGPAGQIRIDAEATAGGLRLRVEDDGPGVPAELRDRLFQEAVTTKADRPGRGLGLLVSRMLMREAGGGLDWVPIPRGTRFELTLPLWRRAASG